MFPAEFGGTLHIDIPHFEGFKHFEPAARYFPDFKNPTVRI